MSKVTGRSRCEAMERSHGAGAESGSVGDHLTSLADSGLSVAMPPRPSDTPSLRFWGALAERVVRGRRFPRI